MNIPFSPPDITELEIQEVADALRSGWITTGPRTKQFEKNIGQYVNNPNVCCLNSQTACAEMALRLLGIGEGDEVITTAYTYTASASVVCHVGAKLVLVDTMPNSFEINYDAIEAAITEKTKVIIPVDLGGVPCDYDRLIDIVERKKYLFKPMTKMQKAIGRISINADGAHSFGAIYKGKNVPEYPDFYATSFHAVKNLTTAEGGALIWKTIPGISAEEIYHQLQLLSLHGQSKDALAKTQLGAWEYDVVGAWYKCNMTDLQAALGLIQLSRYPDLEKRRQEIIHKYDSAFKPLGVQVLEHYTDDYQSSGHLYLTRVPNITSEQRNAIIVKMAELGIATNVHYKPLPMHTAYKKLGFDIQDVPNAYAQFANEITLPLHTCLTDEQVDYVIESYKNVLRDYI